MFLKKIANDIILNHGRNLAHIAIIFPNKRASLWMNDHLLEAAGGSVFAPQYFSISELFQKHSKLILADHIQLVSMLHKTYCKVTGERQTLDAFFPWGEILLSDFDNVDKSMADAEQLFHNISNLHEMDSIDYLTERQKELLEHFFMSFTRNHESKIQQKFIALWNNLFDIYTQFRTSLFSLGIAYEGMLYRDVIENSSADDFQLDHYYAIGFNQLIRCEERLFLKLADRLTIKNDEASISTVYPEANITIAHSLTNDLQARYVEQWLKENDRMTAGRRTAIILCDEHLLPSVTYCLPENVGTVNITAGFPLAETQPASYLATLFELHTEGLTKDRQRFRLSYKRNLEGHPLHRLTASGSTVGETTEFSLAPELTTAGVLASAERAITTVASAINKSELSDNQLLSEAAFRVYNIIVRLKSLHEEGYLDIDPLTLARLYKQIIQTATIPFHGEPAQGIQIMGVLETRNLDFDHILMLSCNEGIIPKGSNDTSAIPYAIKRAFELSTTDDRTNIFAYYFYRLLKRCKDVTLVYNASSSDTSPGEMSRFLLNLIVNNSEQINRISLQTDFVSKTKRPQTQEKTKEDLHQYIEDRLSKTISPSALNTYMRCEKSFYYKYFRNLCEENDEEESMDSAAFGTFFHNAAQEFYEKLRGVIISESMLQPYINKPEMLEGFINRALERTKEERYGQGNSVESGGMEHLMKSIVKNYLVRMLKNDQKFCPFTVVSLENRFYKNYTVETLEGNKTFLIGGAVDRLDLVTTEEGAETLRVVDYKTGSDHGSTKIDSVEDMFDEKKKGSGYYRQTSLYSIAIYEDNKNNPRHLPVAPALYYIRNRDIGSDKKYNPIIKFKGQPLNNIYDIKSDYEEQLKLLLHSIFNKPTFEPTQDITNCSMCPFADLCYE